MLQLFLERLHLQDSVKWDKQDGVLLRDIGIAAERLHLPLIRALLRLPGGTSKMRARCSCFSSPPPCSRRSWCTVGDQRGGGRRGRITPIIPIKMAFSTSLWGAVAIEESSLLPSSKRVESVQVQ